MGSHLDSVPDGGRYDGPLGVLVALEAATRADPHARLTVVVFRDEEGTRFGNGCLGSRSLVGPVGADELQLRDADGVTLADALAALDLQVPERPWVRGRPDAFIEAHLEQGPILDDTPAPVGVVTGIVGMAVLSIGFEGRAGHAGTTPMDRRRDAAAAAAAFVGEVRAYAHAHPVRATVGVLRAFPGAANVIPARCELTVDCRSIDGAALEAAIASLRATAERCAATDGCTASIDLTYRSAPAAMSDDVRAALRSAVAGAGLPVVELESGATHDAAVLATAGVPTGMLFVRTKNDGQSHVPDETVDIADIVLAVDVVAAAIANLDARLRREPDSRERA